MQNAKFQVCEAILCFADFLLFITSPQPSFFDFTFHFTQNSEESMLGIIGSFIAPVFKPAGFGTWQAAVSLLTGLVAKEAVVSSMCLFYGISATAGTEATAILSGTFGMPVAAYAFLVFTLLYVPCVAAFSTMKKEMGEQNIKVVATGGLSELVKDEVGLIDVVDRRLSLVGIKMIYDLNTEK